MAVITYTRLIIAACTVFGAACLVWLVGAAVYHAPPAYDDATFLDRPPRPAPMTAEERGECRTKIVSAFPLTTRRVCENDYRPPPRNPAARLAEPDQYLLDTVGRVIDGDTLDGADTGQRYRLALVDTPERGEPGYAAATSYVERRCPVGAPLAVDLDDAQPSDRYGRTVVVAWCDARAVADVAAGGHPSADLDPPLNARLLRDGHACLDTRFTDSSEFGAAAWVQDGRACDG